MKKIFLSITVLVALTVFFSSNAMAQESEVCLVYFTSNACGDECRLTDSFMGSIMNEYHEILTTIEYSIDTSPMNMDVHNAYRTNYNFPSGVPLVLFGKNNYLLGMDDIYENVESKIYSYTKANGTNCPLSSGYVPPRNLDSGSLPGEPEIFVMRETGEDDEMEDDDPESGGEGENIFEGILPEGEIEINITSMMERAGEPENAAVLIIAVSIIVAIAIVVIMAFRLKGRKEGE